MAVKIAHLYRGIWTSKRRCGWVIVFNRSSQSCFFFYTACEILCSKRQTEKTRFESTKFRKQIKFTRHAFWTTDTYTHVAHTFDCVIFKFSFLCGVVSMSLKAVGKTSHERGLKFSGENMVFPCFLNTHNKWTLLVAFYSHGGKSFLCEERILLNQFRLNVFKHE